MKSDFVSRLYNHCIHDARTLLRDHGSSTLWQTRENDLKRRQQHWEQQCEHAVDVTVKNISEPLSLWTAMMVAGSLALAVVMMLLSGWFEAHVFFVCVTLSVVTFIITQLYLFWWAKQLSSEKHSRFQHDSKDSLGLDDILPVTASTVASGMLNGMVCTSGNVVSLFYFS